ncbi:MAG: YbhB/YbcL family Raf kinase inhibitor-like protein [Patescibacteria group bacterium]
MTKRFVIIIIGALIIIFGVSLFSSRTIAPNTKMTIKSSAFEENGKIPKKYTCDGSPPSAPSGGGGINPPLEITGIPEGTKSLAFIMDDPDAPRGTFTHWVMWDMKPVTEKFYIEENFNSVPEETPIPNPDTGKIPSFEMPTEGVNSAGKIGYIGPCPPPGKPHRYFFKVYALDMENLLPSIPGGELEFNLDDIDLLKQIQGHILDHAELIGIYER